MVEVIGDLSFSVCLPNSKEMDIKHPAMFIHFDNLGLLNIKLNKEYAYRVMANKNLIIGGLNKKLDELIQTHLEYKAKDEKLKHDEK